MEQPVEPSEREAVVAFSFFVMHVVTPGKIKQILPGTAGEEIVIAVTEGIDGNTHDWKEQQSRPLEWIGSHREKDDGTEEESLYPVKAIY
jgi:hypothetical protein